MAMLRCERARDPSRARRKPKRILHRPVDDPGFERTLETWAKPRTPLIDHDGSSIPFFADAGSDSEASRVESGKKKQRKVMDKEEGIKRGDVGHYSDARGASKAVPMQAFGAS